MNESYRGYTIRLNRAALWHAVLVETSSGTILPTKATALLREGRSVALRRAIDLVDLYCRAIEAAEQRAA